MTNSVVDIMDDRLKEKEDREDLRWHKTTRFVASLIAGLLLSIYWGTAILTHQSHMAKVHRETQLLNRCYDEGWNPVTCRRGVQFGWDLKSQGVKTQRKKK